MLSKFHDRQNFEEAYQDARKQRAFASWSIATALLTFRDALVAGLAAHRQYEHLKSEGISHDSALKLALGVCNPASEVPTATSHPASKRSPGRQLCTNQASWFQRKRQRRALAELDDRLLRDIGITRSQALRESRGSLFFAGKA
jgi:uncharacterized protein YjiS (DUF1127 family)